MDWGQLLNKSGHSADQFLEGLVHRLQRRTGFMEGTQVLPYRGYGTDRCFYLKGRVLRERKTDEISRGDSIWKNAVASYRRFYSREVPGVHVAIVYGEQRVEVTSDQEGFFEARFVPQNGLIQSEPWQQVEVSLSHEPDVSFAHTAAPGYVLVPPKGARFGVISDIDDTVLMTHARQVLKMLASTFFKNAHTRLLFPGVAALYRALQAGEADQILNPIFYVSSGPWNLYDLLRDFLEANQIPVGPLCLQDFGFDENKFLKQSHQIHKERNIRDILLMYPELPFILIGDSGQKDPEIYLKLLKELPTRIQAIYIRDVSGAERTTEVQKLFEEARKHGGELMLVKDTFEAGQHAAERGWISEEQLRTIRREMNLPEDEVIAELTEEVASKVEPSIVTGLPE